MPNNASHACFVVGRNARKVSYRAAQVVHDLIDDLINNYIVYAKSSLRAVR